MEESFSASGDAGSARIFFSVGLLEQAAGNEAMAPYQMVSNLQHFINVLKKRPYQWDYDAVFFPDENHNSVFNAATSRGLRYLYRK